MMKIIIVNNNDTIAAGQPRIPTGPQVTHHSLTTRTASVHAHASSSLCVQARMEYVFPDEVRL